MMFDQSILGHYQDSSKLFNFIINFSVRTVRCGAIQRKQYMKKIDLVLSDEEMSYNPN